ncbi:hypothetical protein RDWZM_010005, partial [Blomia tropicalis]
RINANPIMLPASKTPIVMGTQLNITGWGMKNYVPVVIKYEENLQIALVSTINDTECLKEHPRIQDAHIFCAKGDTKMVCPTVGDRGGPAVNNGILKGIMIETLKTDCNDTKSDLFTNVAMYIEWIKSIIPTIQQ